MIHTKIFAVIHLWLTILLRTLHTESFAMKSMMKHMIQLLPF